MDEFQYCPKREDTCFKNVPLLTVISQWFRENQDMDIDFNPVIVIQFGVFCLITLFLIKTSYRIIKTLIKPLLVISGLLIVLYTKQFSRSIDATDFVLNVMINTYDVVFKILDTVTRIVFGQKVVV